MIRKGSPRSEDLKRAIYRQKAWKKSFIDRGYEKRQQTQGSKKVFYGEKTSKSYSRDRRPEKGIS